MPNPNEEKLAQFVGDTVMFAAVRAILYAEFDANTLELVPRGERETAVQAVFDGRNKLMKGFKNLEKYRKEPPRDGTSQGYF